MWPAAPATTPTATPVTPITGASTTVAVMIATL
jgi:hypothetical protein